MKRQQPDGFRGGEPGAVAEAFDVLACVAHPDDAETSCGGLLAKMARRGYRVAICDLTRGELASNGTADIRQQEAAAAAAVLQLTARFNLGLPDGGIDRSDPEHLLAVVRLLRQHRPRLLIAPHTGNRHPDHAACRELVQRARFFAGVHGYDRSTAAILRPVLLQALDSQPMEPSFVVDISEFLPIKLQAIRCYRSQFEATAGSTPTVLNDHSFLKRIETNAAAYGQRIGCAAGEPYWIDAPVPLDDPVATLASKHQAIRP
jgi:bacillithiol biosynthesis deacetylase BshB1